MTHIICFEGIDGAGKTTQINLLAQHLRSMGKIVAIREYPMYESFFGRQIGQLLAGPVSDPKSMVLWYALDRWADYRDNLALFTESDYVLLNRYTLSSVVYQANDLQSWIERLEHTVFGLPRPHIYIVLDVLPGIAQTNMSCMDRDVYERDIALQIRARKLYLEMGDLVIPCHCQGKMLDKMFILSEVLAGLEMTS